MESVNPSAEDVFALANLFRAGYFSKKPRKRKLKVSWRELREYLEEYRDVSGQ